MYVDVNNTKLPKLKKYYLNNFSGNSWTTKNVLDDSILVVFDPASRGNLTLRHEVIYPTNIFLALTLENKGSTYLRNGRRN